MHLDKVFFVLYFLTTGCDQNINVDTIDADFVVNDPTTANEFFNTCSEKYIKNEEAYTPEEFAKCLWHNITDTTEDTKRHKIECFTGITYEMSGFDNGFVPEDCKTILGDELVHLAECLKQEDVLTSDDIELCVKRKNLGENSSIDPEIYCYYECIDSLSAIEDCNAEDAPPVLECIQIIREQEDICLEDCLQRQPS